MGRADASSDAFDTTNAAADAAAVVTPDTSPNVPANVAPNAAADASTNVAADAPTTRAADIAADARAHASADGYVPCDGLPALAFQCDASIRSVYGMPERDVRGRVVHSQPEMGRGLSQIRRTTVGRPIVCSN